MENMVDTPTICLKNPSELLTRHQVTDGSGSCTQNRVRANPRCIDVDLAPHGVAIYSLSHHQHDGATEVLAKDQDSHGYGDLRRRNQALNGDIRLSGKGQSYYQIAWGDISGATYSSVRHACTDTKKNLEPNPRGKRCRRT